MLANKQKTYWITGASSGIGRAITELTVQQGHRVIITSRNKQALEGIAQKNPELIRVLPCDVSKAEETVGLFSKVLPELECLDGIILCAGICDYIDLPDFKLQAFEDAIAVNFLGTVNACKAAYPLLKNAALKKPAKKPFIAGLCSMSSYLGLPRAEAYGASKAAMSYFLNSLRVDIGESIAVIPVYLGFVETPMTAQNDFPMPFIVSPELAAANIMKKLEKRPLRINFPWRLHALLSLFSRMEIIWYSFIVPRLRRTGGVN
jgi:NAD(P)-dependent dehydrogenase (short-subunit alcohol dehydrogenase family)